MIEVFLNNEKIDLYKDENIQVNDSIQDIKDIGKIFTTFSRQFSVPATKRNNKIFKNFYNFDIVDGFDPREKVKSIITKNGATWRKGFIQIENVKLKNNKPSSYKIFFTGEISELKDIFKDDRLSELSGLSAYDHSYTQSNVENGFSNYLTVNNGSVSPSSTESDICYPFISVGSRYAYNNSGGGQLKKVNEDGSLSGSNLDYRDLKPAIRLNRIIEAIESKYDITFSNDFFNTDDFTSLYLWLNRNQGRIGAEEDIIVELFNTDLGYTRDDLNVFFNQETINGQIETEYKEYELEYTFDALGIGEVLVEIIDFSSGQNLNTQLFEFDNDQKIISVNLDYIPTDGYSRIYVPYLKITSEDNSITQLDTNFKLTTIEKQFSSSENITFSNNFLEVKAENNIVIRRQIPKMKVIDFLTSIFKTFNLTAQVVDGIIEVKSLDSFYDSGGTQDISRLVNIEDITVSRVETIKEFNFEFNQSESILIKERNKRVDDEFGNLDFILENTDKVIGGINYQIKSEFYKILFEKLTIKDTGQPTNTVFSWYVDEKQEPLSNEPIIFYTDLKQANGISFQGSGTTPSNYIAGLNAIGTKSINFGKEFDEFTLQPNDNSLFNNFYKNYIDRVFSPQARKVSLSAILRDDFILNYKLNDKIILQNRSYIINDIRIDLSTNKAKIELLTDTRETELSREIVLLVDNYQRRVEEDNGVFENKNCLENYLIQL